MPSKITKANGHIVQSDWAQDDATKFDYIHNKPTKLSDFENDENFAKYNENGELIVGGTPISPNAAVPFGYVTGELADLAELIDNGVGKKTTGGGEIFNDYTNNWAQRNGHAEGVCTFAENTASHAEGRCTKVTYVTGSICGHAEGYGAVAAGTGAHAEGMGYVGSYVISGASGSKVCTINSGDVSLLIPHYTTLVIPRSNFVGLIIAASGNKIQLSATLPSSLAAVTAYAVKNMAMGSGAHSEGNATLALAAGAHAEGVGTQALAAGGHAQGRYNTNGSGTLAHVIGNGSSDTSRADIHTVDWQGNAWYAGDITTGGSTFSAGETVRYRPNLLINGNFTINQRGATVYGNASNTTTAYPASVYSVDRWLFARNYTGTFNASTRTLSTGSKGTYANLQQKIEINPTILAGKAVTFSVDISNTKACQLAIGYNSSTVIEGVINVPASTTSRRCSITRIIPTTLTASDVLYVHIIANGGNDCTAVINNAKLEIGSYATPYSPRSYGEELSLCQRYYQVVYMPNKFLSLQEASSSSYIYVQLPVNPNVATYSTPVITNNNCHASTGSGSSSDLTFSYSTCYYDAKDSSAMIRLSGGGQLLSSPTLLTGFGSIGIETEIK